MCQGVVAAIAEIICQSFFALYHERVKRERELRGRLPSGSRGDFRQKRGQYEFVVGISEFHFILDPDIRSFFDSVNQAWLIGFLKHRINDRQNPPVLSIKRHRLRDRSLRRRSQKDRLTRDRINQWPMTFSQKSVSFTPCLRTNEDDL